MLKQLANYLRTTCGENTKETKDTTNLTLTKNEFVTKILLEKDGQALLNLLESGEHKICESMELIHGYKEKEQTYFNIPGWNNLIAHLKIVNSV